MSTAKPTSTIYQKLLEFQKKINGIKKDAKNPHFKSNYASLPQILSEVKPLLSELGLVLLQPITDGKIETIIIDSESGEKVTSDFILPVNLTPQQIGSAITYYRRYLLAGLLSLEIEDDDAHSASKAPVQQAAKTKPEFTEAMFQKALEANASIVQIRAKYEVTPAIETAYAQFMLNQIAA